MTRTHQFAFASPYGGATSAWPANRSSPLDPPSEGWSRCPGSNWRPRPYQGRALPTELHRPSLNARFARSYGRQVGLPPPPRPFVAAAGGSGLLPPTSRSQLRSTVGLLPPTSRCSDGRRVGPAATHLSLAAAAGGSGLLPPTSRSQLRPAGRACCHHVSLAAAAGGSGLLPPYVSLPGSGRAGRPCAAGALRGASEALPPVLAGAVARHPKPRAKRALGEGWSGRRGSNPRPTAWKAVTLPLSYSRLRARPLRPFALRRASPLPHSPQRALPPDNTDPPTSTRGGGGLLLHTRPPTRVKLVGRGGFEPP